LSSEPEPERRSGRPDRVAVIAEPELPGVLELLEEEGWGAIQLPPAGLDPETTSAWLEQVAEHVAEFRRNGYAVVVLDDGLDPDRLGAAFSGLGVGPLPRLALPAEEDELRDFLHQNAVQPPSAGGLTPDT